MSEMKSNDRVNATALQLNTALIQFESVDQIHLQNVWLKLFMETE